MFAEFGVLNYLTYLVGAIFIILVPGPNTFFVLKTGIAHGVKKGYLAAAGVFIGDAVLMFLAFAGVATLIKTTPVLFNVVRYLGAIYLLWLGGKMLYAVLTQRDGQSDASAEPASAILKRSLTLSLTNPKAILFYVSFFVQFIDVNAKTPGVAFFILALAVIACNTASTVSLPALREKFAFPVVGVVPAIKPAASAFAVSSPRRAKSADRIEGAIKYCFIRISLKFIWS